MRRRFDIGPTSDSFVRADFEQQAMLDSMGLFAPCWWLILEGRLEHQALNVGDPHSTASKVRATFNASSFLVRARSNAQGHSANGISWLTSEHRFNSGSLSRSNAASIRSRSLHAPTISNSWVCSRNKSTRAGSAKALNT